MYFYCMKPEDDNQLNEPQAAYNASGKKRITVFKSFEEENEYTHKMRAALSYEECLQALSRNRKRIFKNILLPNHSLPLFKKVIRVNTLPYEF